MNSHVVIAINIDKGYGSCGVWQYNWWTRSRLQSWHCPTNRCGWNNGATCLGLGFSRITCNFIICLNLCVFKHWDYKIKIMKRDQIDFLLLFIIKTIWASGYYNPQTIILLYLSEVWDFLLIYFKHYWLTCRPLPKTFGAIQLIHAIDWIISALQVTWCNLLRDCG